MPQKKKRTGVKAHKVRSRGVWIAPDLDRKIKGEGGRRGLTEPPYSYYLHLADLVLKPGTSADGASAAANRQRRGAPEPAFEPPSLQNLGASQSQPKFLHEIASTPAPVTDLIPAPLPPLAPALQLPKLNLPKPPRRARMPRPPKASPPKPPKQQQRGKLSMPKPPKRKK